MAKPSVVDKEGFAATVLFAVVGFVPAGEVGNGVDAHSCGVGGEREEGGGGCYYAFYTSLLSGSRRL